MESNNSSDFWYGRVNKHPEDCTREEIFKVMQDFGDSRAKNCTVDPIREQITKRMFRALEIAIEELEANAVSHAQVERIETIKKYRYKCPDCGSDDVETFGWLGSVCNACGGADDIEANIYDEESTQQIKSR